MLISDFESAAISEDDKVPGVTMEMHVRRKLSVHVTGGTEVKKMSSLELDRSSM